MEFSEWLAEWGWTIIAIPFMAIVLIIFVIAFATAKEQKATNSIPKESKNGISLFSIILIVLTVGSICLFLTLQERALPIIYISIVVIFFMFISYLIFENIYFISKPFKRIKEDIQSYTNDCNELNRHIEDLKATYITSYKPVDYGNASYNDNSIYNYRRPELKKLQYKKNIYSCSLSVCKNAQQQPFKYLCKYFNIKPNEENLAEFEKILNNFTAAEEGKVLLKKERDRIISSIKKDIPFLIRHLSYKKLARKLGFEEIDLSQMYFPRFEFLYVSAGGNSSMKCEIILDIENLNKFVTYLSEIVKSKKSAAGQRALMTSTLREKIKERDNYTCQICGLSIYQEPNLLLEIDHIIPISKNGLTIESNLQTLCWRCNRKKGGKLL